MTPKHAPRAARRRARSPRATQTSAAASLALAAPLSAEDCQVQSMADASPTKWHLAHVTWFFETFLLERFEAGFVPFDPAFRVLFNSYYQGVGDAAPAAAARPRVAARPGRRQALSRQRRRAHAGVARRSAATTPRSPRSSSLGLQHEQQHQELILTDIKHALSFNPLAPAYARRWPMAQVRPQPLRWFGYEGGLVELGHAAALDGEFCFDNETPRHRAYAAPFELASRPATFGDFLAFIDDDGYRRPELWLSMGWDWVRRRRRGAPLYWRRDGGRWLIHTLQGAVEIDPHTPVCHLSFFEADAFARWSGARLPTELEWELAARRLAAPVAGNFADRGAFHPLPQKDPVGDEPVQMFGDVWEWTAVGLPAVSRLPAARRARSASTTASSCATSSSCAAARARRRPATSGRATATSFRPTRSGSSAGFASPATSSCPSLLDGGEARRASRLRRPGPERSHDQHAAGDRQVLHEVDLLRHLLGLRHGPEVVEDDAGEQRESGEGDDSLARVEAGHEREAAAELDDDGQRRDQLRQRQALAGDVAGGAVESGDLGEARQDEDQAEQDAADENGGALQRCHGDARYWVRVGRKGSGGEIEDQHLGLLAMVDREPALAGQRGGIAAIEVHAVDVDAAADDVDVGLALRVERALDRFGAVDEARPRSTRRRGSSPSRRGRRATRPGAARRACTASSKCFCS